MNIYRAISNSFDDAWIVGCAALRCCLCAGWEQTHSIVSAVRAEEEEGSGEDGAVKKKERASPRGTKARRKEVKNTQKVCKGEQR